MGYCRVFLTGQNSAITFRCPEEFATARAIAFCRRRHSRFPDDGDVIVHPQDGRIAIEFIRLPFHAIKSAEAADVPQSHAMNTTDGQCLAVGKEADVIAKLT
jgi:hypothetical protein